MDFDWDSSKTKLFLTLSQPSSTFSRLSVDSSLLTSASPQTIIAAASKYTPKPTPSYVILKIYSFLNAPSLFPPSNIFLTLAPPPPSAFQSISDSFFASRRGATSMDPRMLMYSAVVYDIDREVPAQDISIIERFELCANEIDDTEMASFFIPIPNPIFS